MNATTRSLTVLVYAPRSTAIRVLVDGITSTDEAAAACEIAHNVVEELASVPRAQRLARVVSDEEITDINP